ncbi:hypothetical protein LXL04_011342 [Taraxacum kok-saghyz]
MSIRPMPWRPPMSLRVDRRVAGDRVFPFIDTGSPDTIPISTYLEKTTQKYGQGCCAFWHIQWRLLFLLCPIPSMEQLLGDQGLVQRTSAQNAPKAYVPDHFPFLCTHGQPHLLQLLLPHQPSPVTHNGKTSVVCGPYLQTSAEEEVDQTSAVCKKKTCLQQRSSLKSHTREEIDRNLVSIVGEKVKTSESGGVGGAAGVACSDGGRRRGRLLG